MWLQTLMPEAITDVSKQPDPRPISPFLIGPYYRPPLTSMLSIASRLAGIFVTALTMPVMFLYLLAIAGGPESHARFVTLLGSLPGKAFCLVSLLCLCYHLANGIRHLVWDTGRAMSLKAIYGTSYLMLAGTCVLFALVLWRALA